MWRVCNYAVHCTGSSRQCLIHVPVSTVLEMHALVVFRSFFGTNMVMSKVYTILKQPYVYPYQCTDYEEIQGFIIYVWTSWDLWSILLSHDYFE